MKGILFLCILFVVFIVLMPPQQEGFNTYFRQSIRPHIRTLRDAHSTVTYHFNSKFKDFGQSLGFSY